MISHHFNSSLENIRLPTEAHSIAKKNGLSPVYSSEKLHDPDRQAKTSERRKGRERRKYAMRVSVDRRRLKQRRTTANKQTEELANVLKSRGRIIDLEV